MSSNATAVTLAADASTTAVHAATVAHPSIPPLFSWGCKTLGGRRGNRGEVDEETGNRPRVASFYGFWYVNIGFLRFVTSTIDFSILVL
jgi:hypothetical protein